MPSTIPSPLDLRLEFSPPPIVEKFRSIAKSVLKGDLNQLVVIVGPCSIQSFPESIEYAIRLRKLQIKLQEKAFLIMRVFVEKPRTKIGWKGFLYDPYLDHSNKIKLGLIESRRLLRDINLLGVPCATEFLDPLIAPYYSDLISWGLIGARTALSQPHRQLASNLPFPIGIKNPISGPLSYSIDSIISSRISHTNFGIDDLGKVSIIRSPGNKFSHLVLRGTDTNTNYDAKSIEETLAQLKKEQIEEHIIVDCAHGNSRKIAKNQILVFNSLLQQIKNGNKAIKGLMLESNLHNGSQAFPRDKNSYKAGISITDPCLSWEETEELLLKLN
jgi:3-deoxy-7-phosphoheptulonate synthase